MIGFQLWFDMVMILVKGFKLIINVITSSNEHEDK